MNTTTFKGKFDAAKEKSYYQGIANKILSNMNHLRSSANKSPNTVRRWIWELLQNANDAAGDTPVNVEITLKERSEKKDVIFCHDGLPFSAENIRNLIEQTSTKDRQKTQTGRRKKVGKFGTGFITTHLLSEIVHVRGVTQEDNLPYKKFKLELDRSGQEPEDLMASVEAALLSVDDLDDQEPYLNYNPVEYNTYFQYELNDATSLEVAHKGIADLKISLPYALCLVEGIAYVTLYSEGWKYRKIEAEFSNAAEVRDVTIEIVDDLFDEVIETHYFKVLTKDFTSILLPVHIEDGDVSIKQIPATVPKVFCDFPLIGTESFPFPVIINNPNFNPTDPRDGIYLGDSEKDKLSPENKIYVTEAVHLFKRLLAHAISNKWDNLHELAKLGALREPVYSLTSPTWFDHTVTKPLKELLLRSAIVKNSNGALRPILDVDGKQVMWFPAASSKEMRVKLFDVCVQWSPDILPQRDMIEFWNQITWSEINKLTFDMVATGIESNETLQNIANNLHGIDIITWLNSVYTVFKLDEKGFAAIMEKRAIVPDQAGGFSKRNSLQKQDGPIESTFLDILEKLGIPIREQLAAEGVDLNFTFSR